MPQFTLDWQSGERSRRETRDFATQEEAEAEAKALGRSMRQDALAGEEDRTGWRLCLLDEKGRVVSTVPLAQGTGPSGQGLPGAGPHADPALMNEDATPGAGTLPPVGATDDANIQPTS